MSQIIAISVISCQLKVSNTDAQNLNYETSVVPGASNLYQSPEYNGDYRSAKYLAQRTLLKNGNSPSLTKQEQYSGSGKEKGSIHSATLWDYSDGSALDFLRCSILSLRPHASSTQEEKLALGFSSLSRSTLASISSIKSLGNRIPLYVDLLFLWPVAMVPAIWSFFNRIDNTTRFKFSEVFKQNMVDVFKQTELTCLNTLSTGKAQVINKIATPQSAGTLLRRLTTNVNVSNEVAMLNHTQTRPKFQYLFLAVCRSDLNAKPHRESVTAHSEQDARRSLAGQFVLSFAGRIPAQGVCNA
ncbi:host cell division inhibitor Icd-like protein [Yersinia kristensenii]